MDTSNVLRRLRNRESEQRRERNEIAGNMEEKRLVFRALSKRLLDQQTCNRPETPSLLLIREDRERD